MQYGQRHAWKTAPFPYASGVVYAAGVMDWQQWAMSCWEDPCGRCGRLYTVKRALGPPPVPPRLYCDPICYNAVVNEVRQLGHHNE